MSARSAAVMAIRHALADAARTLTPVSPTAQLDAEILLRHVMGISRAQMIAHDDRLLTHAQQEMFSALLTRRRRGEPIAHITQTREFWSLPLKVSRATLIPRPETELLVEQALARIPADAAWRIADLGTGCGAIACALARERPQCDILATDISPAALRIARENANRLGLNNIGFVHGAWFETLADRSFDMIVSNPPYVCAGDPHLETGDVRFEPRAALVAGRDGLDAIRVIVGAAPRHLREPGWLLVEIGWDQGPAVLELMGKRGFAARLYDDTAGQSRVCVGQAGKTVD